jgi:hypothetical protein
VICIKKAGWFHAIFSIVNSYEFLIFHPAIAYRTFMRPALLIAPGRARKNEVFMLDILFIAIGLAFLGGAMLYAVACDRM